MRSLRSISSRLISGPRVSRASNCVSRRRYGQQAGPSEQATRVLAFGDGSFGQLGNGVRYGFEAAPTPIEFNFDDQIVSIAAGDYHSLAVTQSGRVFSWGWATFQGSESMSPGSGTNDALPQPILGELESRQVDLICAGRRHTLAATKDCQLFSFGIGENGQLGHGDTQNRRAPTRVAALAGVPLACVTAGWGHSIAVTKEGQVFSWGWNEEGQCGIGTTDQISAVPKFLESLKGVKIVKAFAGADHTLLIDIGGNLYGFGSAKMHQIGTGSTENVLRPIHLRLPSQERVCEAACGFGHSIVICESGNVYSFGYNPDGQCGTGSAGTVETPTLIEVPDATKIISGSCGRLSSLLIDDAGALFSFGNATKGRLGNGSRRSVLEPTPVDLEALQAISVASGMDHCLVLAK